MITTLYFDLGGVIVRTENKEPRTQLAAQFGMTYAQMEGVVFGGGPYSVAARASVGEVTEQTLWMQVARQLGVPTEERERIHAQFFGGDSIDWDIIAFLRQARTQYKTGLISNAWDGLRPWIRTQKFEDAFEHLTISAEVHIAKPNAGIYRHALAALHARPEESIFVDDFIENIQAARALGFHAVHFQNPAQAMAEVQEILQQ